MSQTLTLLILKDLIDKPLIGLKFPYKCQDPNKLLNHNKQNVTALKSQKRIILTYPFKFVKKPLINIPIPAESMKS